MSEHLPFETRDRLSPVIREKRERVMPGGVLARVRWGLPCRSATRLAAEARPRTRGSSNYFAQGTNGNESDDVYFSFTVMTTTGFGDLSAASHVSRAIAVIEMLTGQLYLVTVIGAVVAMFASRRRP